MPMLLAPSARPTPISDIGVVARILAPSTSELVRSTVNIGERVLLLAAPPGEASLSMADGGGSEDVAAKALALAEQVGEGSLSIAAWSSWEIGDCERDATPSASP